MKVIEIKSVEDCFDNSQIKELLLSEKIDEEFMYKLSEGAIIQYFPFFPRPFFKIRKNKIYDIKGIIGNNTLRVHFKNMKAYSIKQFVEMINEL